MSRSLASAGSGQPLWRSLDAAGDPDLAARAEREFPALAGLAPLDRRAALRVMSASLALAGLNHLTQHREVRREGAGGEELEVVELPRRRAELGQATHRSILTLTLDFAASTIAPRGLSS